MNFLAAIKRIAIVMVMALAVGACASTSTSEGFGEYIDDSAITAKVKAALLADKETSALSINVETFKGVVQLSGFAKSRAEANRAFTLARGVAGVRSVKNDILIR